MGIVRAHLLISGMVQGVGFRAHAQRQAELLGVRGWVRNLADGRVEAAAEGTQEAVEAFIAWCRRGPAMARVDGVKVEWELPQGATRFEVLATR
ncbi:MAG: acylphosphatase [Bacillota bacterium]|nr:acylphosphatase [Bacillota bacterium]